MLSTVLIALAAQAMPPSSPPRNEPCWKIDNSGSVPVHVYQGDRQCVDLAPPRKMTGVWVNDFEGSAFYEGAQTIADTQGKKANIWFSIDDQTDLPPDFRQEYGHAYRMVIIGRTAMDMTREPLHGYGHMSMSSGLVLADRIVVMEDLGPVR